MTAGDLTADDIREAQQILAVEAARDEVVAAALDLAAAYWRRDYLDEDTSTDVQNAQDHVDNALAAYFTAQAAAHQDPAPTHDPKETA
ncbi:MAG TPA: hypothetical protein VE465_02235 [Streptosporangiaceae bacterium]|jgi:hypothetical protein|nr:hypothetical protein [Streptosporangiaceae bacterium]